MTKIGNNEVEKLIRENPHLKRYLEEIEKKMTRPTVYSKVPRDVKDQEFPNIIYSTKGLVFIHIFKTKDMEKPEYHAITPELDNNSKKKRDRILELIYEKAHQKTDIKTQDELRKNIKEVLEKVIILDEKSRLLTDDFRNLSGLYPKMRFAGLIVNVQIAAL